MALTDIAERERRCRQQAASIAQMREALRQFRGAIT
jgi:hypothetical protein